MKVCIVVQPGLDRLLGLEKAREPSGPWFTEPGSDGSFSLFSSPLPAEPELWQAPPADLHILPARFFIDLRPEGRPAPAFAYGPIGLAAESIRQGCADYIREPLSVEEVTARAQRLDRVRLRLGDVLVEVRGRRISSGKLTLELTDAEYRLGRVLALNLNTPVPRAALAMALWGSERDNSRAPDMHISALRRKLEALGKGAGKRIKAVRGLGYALLGEYCG
jgi:DNA-binding winged helix-turn-helix (wHTH) protein